MKLFTSVVLAGSRGGAHPVAQAANVPVAVMARVGDRSILARVFDSIVHSNQLAPGLVVGDAAVLLQSDDIAQRVQTNGFRFQPSEAGPSASALAALLAMQQWPCVLVAGDHALLTAAAIDEFCAQTQRLDADLTVAFVRHGDVQQRLPGTRRTQLKFAGGGVCGCNLYALKTPRALGAIRLWRQVESYRKQPWRMIRMLGVMPLLKYFVGTLSLQDALAHLGRLAQCRIAPVYLSDPIMAVDVDSVGDWQLAQALDRQRSQR